MDFSATSAPPNVLSANPTKTSATDAPALVANAPFQKITIRPVAGTSTPPTVTTQSDPRAPAPVSPTPIVSSPARESTRVSDAAATTSTTGSFTNRPRFRQTFHYSELGESYNDHLDEVLYMDEQSQTELIADLQLQDLQNNEFYCKALSILTVCPLPYYVIRYFYSHYGKWIFNENVFYIISLCFSFQTVPVPVLLPMKEKNYLTIKSTQMSWTYLQQLNIVLSGFMCLASWLGVYFGLDEPIQSHDAFLSTYPFLMAFMGFAMRQTILAVNFTVLEDLRYNYLGA